MCVCVCIVGLLLCYGNLLLSVIYAANKFSILFFDFIYLLTLQWRNLKKINGQILRSLKYSEI